MSLYRYLQRQGGFPSAKETGLTPHATVEADKIAEKVVSEETYAPTKKRRYTTTFTDENKAKIGRYATENGVMMGVMTHL